MTEVSSVSCPPSTLRANVIPAKAGIHTRGHPATNGLRVSARNDGLVYGRGFVCRRTAPSAGSLSLVRQFSKPGECAGADVVLDPLRIQGRCLLIDPQRKQEAVDDVVPFPALGGQAFSLAGQFDRTVRLGGQQTGLVQAGDDPRDRHMADPETGGQILDAAGRLLVMDFRDGLDIIFRGFMGVIVARSPMRIRFLVGAIQDNCFLPSDGVGWRGERPPA